MFWPWQYINWPNSFQNAWNMQKRTIVHTIIVPLLYVQTYWISHKRFYNDLLQKYTTCLILRWRHREPKQERLWGTIFYECLECLIVMVLRPGDCPSCKTFHISRSSPYSHPARIWIKHKSGFVDEQDDFLQYLDLWLHGVLTGAVIEGCFLAITFVDSYAPNYAILLNASLKKAYSHLNSVQS